MKIRIEMSKSEMISVKSILSVFENDESFEICKKKVVKEVTDHTSEEVSFNEDGSFSIELNASEMFSVCVINWMRDILSQTKSLIFGAVHTYKNITSMLGVSKLSINGEDVQSSKKVSARTRVDGMTIRASRFVPKDADEKVVRQEIISDILKKFNEKTTEEISEEEISKE